MKIIEVSTPSHVRSFLDVVNGIYENEKNWIRPLDKDIEVIFDQKKNKLFRNSICIRWILNNDQGKTIGRIAAFVNKNTYLKGNKQPTGGFGFFECIDNQEAANLLFETAKQWLKNQDMEAMDGPINFGERDRWWGLLIDGFHAPNYGMFYHPPFYKTLFENYGFQIYFKQYTYRRIIENNLNPKVYEKGKRVLSNPDYTFRHITKDNIDKYALDFVEIYNKAWAKHLGVGNMRPEQGRLIMKQLKPILDPELIWFGYHKETPVAFYIMIPELNQIFRHFNGKFGIFQKLQFLWYKWRKTIKKTFGVIFGVIPEHQGKGVEAAIVVAYSKIALKDNYQYNEMEFNWIGDFNPKMMRVCEDVGGVIYKTHATYRKLFDPNAEFERMSEI